MLSLKQRVHSIVWAYRMLRGTTSPKELPHFSQQLSSDDIAFDVGAHAGAWAYPLSRLMSHVYAFEALPYYAQVLGPALRLAGRRNVTVLNRAVSNKAGTVSMVWRSSSGVRLTGLTHVASQAESLDDTVTVECLSLDEFVMERSLTSRRIGLLKCDVEGFECNVIEGARELLRRCRPLVFCEAQNTSFARYGKHSSDLIQLMTGQGYRPHVCLPDGSISPVEASTYCGEGDILFRPE